MCLGIPGEIRTVTEGVLRSGTVAFGGIVKDVCLAYVPEARVGDYVVVHAGFAITVIDPEAAARTFSYLDDIGATADGEEREP